MLGNVFKFQLKKENQELKGEKGKSNKEAKKAAAKEAKEAKAKGSKSSDSKQNKGVIKVIHGLTSNTVGILSSLIMQGKQEESKGKKQSEVPPPVPPKEIYDQVHNDNDVEEEAPPAIPPHRTVSMQNGTDDGRVAELNKKVKDKWRFSLRKLMHRHTYTRLLIFLRLKRWRLRLSARTTGWPS